MGTVLRVPFLLEGKAQQGGEGGAQPQSHLLTVCPRAHSTRWERGPSTQWVVGTRHMSCPGARRQAEGEPGTQLSVWALSSAASRSLAWAHQGWVVSPGASQSHDEGVAHAQGVTVLTWTLTPESCSPAPVPLGHSRRGLGREPRVDKGQVPGAASARGSGRLAPGLGAGTVWTVSLAPERNSECVHPLLLTEPRAVGGRAIVKSPQASGR